LANDTGSAENRDCEESRLNQIGNMKRKSIIVASMMISFIGITGVNAQDLYGKKIKPFTVFGVTLTAVYSQGYLYQQTTGGTNFGWGLVTHGGSSVIDCRPGDAICKMEFSLSLNRVVVDANGNKGIDKTDDDISSVVLSNENGRISFGVDVRQLSPDNRMLYEKPEWKVNSAFILSPEVVRALKLYEGKEEMVYVIPAGSYPLYRDGNIAFWTFEPPR
jgi:hypothetical protein